MSAGQAPSTVAPARRRRSNTVVHHTENRMKTKRSPRRPRLAAPPGSQPLLKLADVGGVLGVSVRTLQGWRSTGRLRVICLTPRSVRIEQSEVDRLIAEARQ